MKEREKDRVQERDGLFAILSDASTATMVVALFSVGINIFSKFRCFHLVFKGWIVIINGKRKEITVTKKALQVGRKSRSSWNMKVPTK